MKLTKRTGRFRYPAITGAAILAGFVFLAICTIFTLTLLAAVSPLFGTSTDIADTVVSQKHLFSAHVLRTAAFTLKVAVGSTIIAAVIGIPAAFFTAKRRFPGRRFLLSLSSVPLCIPALLVALGFVSFFGMGGTCNRILMSLWHLKSPPLKFLYSFMGIIIAQGFYNFPLVMGTVSRCWEQIPGEEADAARLLGAGEFRIFRTVTIYQISGAIASACIPIFLYSFFSFMIVLLFGNVGGSTLEVEIYQAARNTLDFREAASLALFETLCAMSVVAVYGMTERRASMSKGLSFTGETAVRYRIGKNPYLSPTASGAERSGFVFLAMLILFFFLAPFAGIVVAGFLEPVKITGVRISLAVFEKLFAAASFRKAVWNTIRTATTTGFLSVVTAFVYVCIARKRDPESKSILVKTIPLLPMAVSSTVTGFGITLLVRHGSPAVLVLAQTALTWPLAFRQIYATLNRLPRETEDAANLLSTHFTDTITRIYLPFSRPGLLSAFGFCFAVSCGDTTLPLILSIPQFDTLSLYTYRLAGSYRFSQSCACGTVLGLVCAVIFAVAERAGRIHTGKS